MQEGEICVFLIRIQRGLESAFLVARNYFIPRNSVTLDLEKCRISENRNDFSWKGKYRNVDWKRVKLANF